MKAQKMKLKIKSNDELLKLFSKLPLSIVNQLHETSKKFLRTSRKDTKFSVGDDLIEVEGPRKIPCWTSRRASRRGKLIAIKELPILKGCYVGPDDFLVDGVPHYRCFYIGCVGPGWKVGRGGTVNHSWVSQNEAKGFSYERALYAIERSFRSGWYRLEEYENGISCNCSIATLLKSGCTCEKN